MQSRFDEFATAIAVAERHAAGDELDAPQRRLIAAPRATQM